MTEFPEDVWAAACEAAADVFLKPSEEPYAVIIARAIMADRASRIRSCPLPDDWAIDTILHLSDALRWVRVNYASGSTLEINARIDAAIAKAEGRP